MNQWPALSYKNGKDTYETFLLFTQIIGKIKVATLPWVNHAWHSTLRLTPWGLTTMSMPFQGRHFQVDMNLINDEVAVIVSDGSRDSFKVIPGLSVAGFYKEMFQLLQTLGISIKIHGSPNEVDPAILFKEDEDHKWHDAEEIKKFHRALLLSQDVFRQFRAQFRGKCSPVHFFWGAADLAVSRFSGRPAPEHPGGIPNLPDFVAKEAYDKEVCSTGFWPGSEGLPYAAYYCYIYPEPDGFKTADIKPGKAFYSNELGEFILAYDDVRNSDDPVKTLMDFLQTTYDAAATLADWNRKEMEVQNN